jgi:hypothetical protein
MPLFRYRGFNKQFLADEIERGMVFHWRVSDQNDPNEGLFKYDTRVTLMRVLVFLHRTRSTLAGINVEKDKTWLTGLNAAESNDFIHSLVRMPQSQLPALARSLIARGHFATDAGRAGLVAGHNRMLDRTLIACFSGARDSPAMFAHYASNHSGVCIEYQGSNANLFRVRYRDSPHVLGIFEARSDVLFGARVLTKNTEWEHEKEVRHTLYDLEPGLYELPGLKVSDVVLGFRADVDCRSAVISMAKSSNYPGIKVWGVRRAELQYGFDRERIQ